jgi:hypothetical protein
MARNPEALLVQLKERQSKQADDLERHIDADLDQNWSGGEFRFSRFQGHLDDGVVAELRRRYECWALRQEIDQDGDGTLVLVPLLAEHRAKRAG